MGVFRFIGLSLAGGVAGFLLGAVGASVVAAVIGMPSREGGPGFFAAGIGILTGVLGIVATILYLLHASGVTGGRLALGSAMAVGGVFLLMGVSRWSYVQSQGHFTKKYGSVRLDFEVLPPAGEARRPDLSGISVELREDQESTRGEWAGGQPPPIEGRDVFSGNVRLYRITSRRMLVLSLPDGQSRVFALGVPRNPTDASSRKWSDWSSSGAPDAGPKWMIRYRVAM